MKVAILSIGDEILSGDILNTNAQFLSESCWQEGLAVAVHLSVRDEEVPIRDALLSLASQADVILCTGGLGPTMDDFTIEIAARTFGVDLVEDAETIRLLEKWFVKRGRTLSANNRKQALIPVGGKALHNKGGTAPGVHVPFGSSHFYFMPGVPKEMRAIFRESVLPEIVERRSQQGRTVFFLHRILRTFGAAESELDNKLKDLFDSRLNIGEVRVGFRVSFPDVLIKLSCWGENQVDVENNLERIGAQVRERVGTYVYTDEYKTLETVVGEALMAGPTRCACAESCTGGLLAHRLTSVPGISSVFAGGVVAYSNELKMKILGVSESTLTKHGAVSEECAREMLTGIRRITGAELCAAVTGIAGPDGGTTEKPVGTVFVGISKGGDSRITQHVLPFPREMFKQVVSSIVLREWWLRQNT